MTSLMKTNRRRKSFWNRFIN